jgi:hypothetical protein
MRRRLESPPGDGNLLRLLAIAHTLVGVAFYRDELRSIGRDGLVAAVPYRGPRSTAFWFLVASPLVWALGILVDSAEQAGDRAALRRAHGLSLIAAALAIVCMPVSGFWGWLLISARGLRRNV